MNLGDFLEQAAQDRPAWNCCTMPADWGVALGYPDFAAAWRGVTDPKKCEDIPRAAGGLATLWAREIGDTVPLAAPPYRRGDVGVVSVRGMEAGAIFTGDKWAVRTERGISFARLDEGAVVRVWRP